MRRAALAYLSFAGCVGGAYLVIRVQQFRNAGWTIKPGTMLWDLERMGLAIFIAGFIGTVACLVGLFIEDWRRFNRP